MRLLLILSAILGVSGAAPISQFDPPVHALAWHVVETPHFKVYYTSGCERVAASVARSAEEAYGPITDLYNYRPPDKTAVVIRDHGDIANGFAAYFQNRIEVWASSLDYEFRSTHDWIKDVITHEFTHIVQLGASKKAPAAIPQVYFQWFRLEPEYRTDVAEGLPNVLASYAVPTVTIPMWFAEGVAQYQSDSARHDWWDAHRDMILRVAVLSDSQLSYRAMEGFYDHDGREAEMVYDHGYAFVRWLAATYGDSALGDLTRMMATWHTWDFDRALRKLTGKPARKVYGAWIADLRGRYREFVESRDAAPAGEKLEAPGTRLTAGSLASSLRNSPATGTVACARSRMSPLASFLRNSPATGTVACARCRALFGGGALRAGYYHAAPAWSPDGSLLAYVSNEGHDYDLASVWVRKPGTDELTVAPESYRASSTISWFPDQRTVVFSRAARDEDNEWRYNDLVKADLQTGEAIVLTHQWRARYPSISPDGRRIVFVRNARGTTNLMLMDADGGNIRPLTHWTDGTQVFTPRWSPDGVRLAVSIARDARRDVAILLLPSSGDSLAIERVFASDGDDRDPAFSPDGQRLVFSSSVDGVFNLYEADLRAGTVLRITNVVGGAFYPDVARDGRIAYASYEAPGYVIRIIPADSPRTPVNPSLFAGTMPERGTFVADFAEIGLQRAALADRHVPHFQSPAVLPRVGLYGGHWRVGAYVFTGDIWDDALLLGGYWVSPDNWDYDAFVTAELQHALPWPLTFDAIRIVRHTKEDTTFSGKLSFDGVTYGLNSFSATVKPRWRRYDLDVHALYQRFDARIDQTLLPRTDVGYNYTYYHGAAVGGGIGEQAIKPFTTADIAPQGYRWNIRYDWWWNWFFKDFDSGSQLLSEAYTPFYYNEVSVDGAYYLPMPWHGEHTFGFEGRAAALFDVDASRWPVVSEASVDSFFYTGAGGIIGLRGYTYYQLQGSRTAWGRILYRLPLARNIDLKIGPLFFDKLYLTAFAEAGRVWRQTYADPWVAGYKRDVGAEVRADIFSFYGYPSRVSVAYARALDAKPGTDKTKVYLTVLFGYL